MSVKHFGLLIALPLALLLFASPLRAQKKDADIKFRLAQSYERSGDFEAAIRLYRELYQTDSLNVVIIDALKRDLLQLKRYDEVIDLIGRVLRRTPGDVNLLGQLGSVYAQTADTKKATETWERAIASDPAKESTYRFIGSWVMQSRLFEYAITVYKRGRTACGDPLLFTADIAYLYSIMLNYADATKEYIAFLRGNPSQLTYVQSRIAAYTGKSDGLLAATTVVEQAARTDGAEMSFQKLLAWLYMEGKDFQKAFDVYTTIDEKTNAGGRELFAFAERALKERGYAVASQAYTTIISRYPKFEALSLAKFGYARTLEEIDVEKDTSTLFGPLVAGGRRPESESGSMYADAINVYNKVIAEFAGTEVAARSLYRIALIQQDRFGDLDAARTALEALLKTYSAFSQIAVEARLVLADVYLAIGDMERSAQQCAAVAGKAPYIGEQRERAAYRLAELDYFAGKFTDCLGKLADLTRNPNSDATNDALGLQIFIQENMKSGDAALKEYALADLLLRQRKLSEAIGRFESVLKAYAGSELIDETLLRIASAYAQMRRYQDAAAMYERLASDYPESIALDRALIQLGRIYAVGLKDVTKAIAAYQQLLEKFPNSIYVSEARRRVRELRGDSL